MTARATDAEIREWQRVAKLFSALVAEREHANAATAESAKDTEEIDRIAGELNGITTSAARLGFGPPGEGQDWCDVVRQGQGDRGH